MSTYGLSEGDVKATFPWPIKIEIPAGYDKKLKPLFKIKKMECEFNYLDEEQTDEVLEYLANPADDDEEVADTESGVDVKNKKNNRYFARLILNSYKAEQFTDADGKPIEPDAAGIERLLKIPYVNDAILKSFRQSRGGKAAQRGN